MNKSNSKRLDADFFNQNTLSVAKSLLGKILCVKNDRKTTRGIVVETEAYRGEDDLACHASKGRTKRTETMYLKAGTIYVCMIYGMYFCLNIVTEDENYPAAVLIRGVLPPPSTSDVEGGEVISGPGRVCRYLGIDKSFNGLNVSGDKIWLEDWGIKAAKKNIVVSKRIGVDYAKHCKDYLWRFSKTSSTDLARPPQSRRRRANRKNRKSNSSVCLYLQNYHRRKERWL